MQCPSCGSLNTRPVIFGRDDERLTCHNCFKTFKMVSNQNPINVIKPTPKLAINPDLAERVRVMSPAQKEALTDYVKAKAAKSSPLVMDADRRRIEDEQGRPPGAP